ncbi:MAG: hypothetical protein IPO22_04045 [Anaerolineales bacterium]|nr:hypothetical protein [Anaerolineales bacterium]
MKKLILKKFAPWLALAVTLMGGFCEVFLLTDKGMWLDETFSVWLANKSVPDMLQWIVKIDQHPPLYYLLLHYWLGAMGIRPMMPACFLRCLARSRSQSYT